MFSDNRIQNTLSYFKPSANFEQEKVLFLINLQLLDITMSRSQSIVTLELDMKFGGRPFYLIEACTISNVLSGKNRKNFVPILI